MKKVAKTKVAVSACLLGCACRYDANHNLNETLLELLASYEIIPFCPEDHCFGTPRPTMDLVQKEQVVAISNETMKTIKISLNPSFVMQKIFLRNTLI